MKHSDPATGRQADLAKIHLAKKQLGMDDEAYRAILWSAARVRSSADLDDAGRKKVLNHLRACGAKFASKGKTPRKEVPSYPGKPHNMTDQLGKVEALLADMKLPWRYADSMAKRMFGIERVAWVRKTKDLQAIIAALTYEHEKRALLEGIQERLRVLHLDEGYVEKLLQGHPKADRWQRSLPVLRAVSKHLWEKTAWT